MATGAVNRRYRYGCMAQSEKFYAPVVAALSVITETTRVTWPFYSQTGAMQICVSLQMH